jgi:L-alanine-DL-glutamate epimerase-like enolase superfamily enzyme
MPVSSVRATAARIPVSRATQMSTRVLAQRDYLLVEVTCSETDEIGLGYTYAGTSGGLSLADIVDDLLTPALLGSDPDDILAMWDQLYQETLLAGRRGGVVRAMSAVDMALWDLSAKRKGVPLAVLLGGVASRVPAYASGGYYRPDDGPWDEAVAKEISFNKSLGFADHKIKVGRLTVEEDTARVAAAVDAIGAGGRLALDANNAYRDVGEALRAIRSFEAAAGGLGLWWVEEPFAADDIQRHADLTRRVETTIATGEIHQTRVEFRQLIEQKACGLLQPDAGVIGGVGEWIRVARAAETFGLPVAPHWHANVHAHLAAAAPNCIAIEHFALEKDLYNFELLLEPASRLRVADGFAEIPDRPGIGIALDTDAVAQFAVTR